MLIQNAVCVTPATFWTKSAGSISKASRRRVSCCRIIKLSLRRSHSSFMSKKVHPVRRRLRPIKTKNWPAWVQWKNVVNQSSQHRCRFARSWSWRTWKRLLGCTRGIYRFCWRIVQICSKGSSFSGSVSVSWGNYRRAVRCCRLRTRS